MKKIQISPIAFLICLVVVCGACISGFVAARLMSANSEHASQQQRLQSEMKAMVVKADSASAGKAVSMATGAITNEVEGVFILDHLTGRLQCWLLNPRTGDIGGIYAADVLSVMGLDKGDPDFVMTTGRFFLNRRGGALRPADSIVYVGEGKSGKVVGFSLAYDKAGIQRGVVQQGELAVVCQGSIRDTVIRE